MGMTDDVCVDVFGEMVSSEIAVTTVFHYRNDPRRVAVLLISSVIVLLAVHRRVELARNFVLFLGVLLLVAAGVIVLRKTDPNRARPFRAPLVPWVPIGAILTCAWLMRELPRITWIRFGIWLVIGLVTVNSHVRSIYSKLGVTSRAAATRYALERHLV